MYKAASPKVETTSTLFSTQVEAFRHHFNTCVSLFTSQLGALHKYTNDDYLTIKKYTPQNISEQHSIFHSPTRS